MHIGRARVVHPSPNNKHTFFARHPPTRIIRAAWNAIRGEYPQLLRHAVVRPHVDHSVKHPLVLGVARSESSLDGIVGAFNGESEERTLSEDDFAFGKVAQRRYCGPLLRLAVYWLDLELRVPFID